MTVLAPDLAAWRKSDPPPDGYVTAAAFDGVITYRLLDYYTRVGYLHAAPSTANTGSGMNRLWPASEVNIACAITRLRAAGIEGALAADIARRGPSTYLLCAGVEIVATGEVWDAPQTRRAKPLTISETSRIEQRIARGHTPAQIAADFDVDPTLVDSIRKRLGA